MKKLIASLLLISLNLVPAFAHEYWFEPESFFLAPKEKTTVRLFVGDGLINDREERPFQQNKTSMFSVFSRDGRNDLISGLKDGALPIYHFSGDAAGNYLLAMERNWTYLTLESDKFDEYLREDGMEYIIAEREKTRRKQKGWPGALQPFHKRASSGRRETRRYIQKKDRSEARADPA